MRVEFIGDVERVHVQTQWLRDSEGRRVSVVFAQGSGVLLKMMVWGTSPLRLPGTGQTRTRALVSSSRFWSQWSWKPFLTTCRVTPQMLSFVLEDSREIVNSLTFTRRMYIKARVRPKKDYKQQKSRLSWVPSVSLS